MNDLASVPMVWVTQERQGFNYTDAEKFGEIEFVTSREYTLPMNSPGNAGIKVAIITAAAKFNPDTDYLLLSGSPVIAGVLIGNIIKKHDPKVIRVLKWNKRDNDYNPITIDI